MGEKKPLTLADLPPIPECSGCGWCGDFVRGRSCHHAWAKDLARAGFTPETPDGPQSPLSVCHSPHGGTAPPQG